MSCFYNMGLFFKVLQYLLFKVASFWYDNLMSYLYLYFEVDETHKKHSTLANLFWICVSICSFPYIPAHLQSPSETYDVDTRKRLLDIQFIGTCDWGSIFLDCLRPGAGKEGSVCIETVCSRRHCSHMLFTYSWMQNKYFLVQLESSALLLSLAGVVNLTQRGCQV